LEKCVGVAILNSVMSRAAHTVQSGCWKIVGMRLGVGRPEWKIPGIQGRLDMEKLGTSGSHL
jgi:hypothetical protein